MWQVLFKYEFLQNSVAAALLASVACGIVGSFVVVRRVVFLSGGISHTAYGGIGLSLFLGSFAVFQGTFLAKPIFGAMLFAVASALIISWIRTKFDERIDTLIGILWASGMSLGILFINITPGYVPNPVSYLFGSLIGVGKDELLITLILDIAIVLVVFVFYRQLHAVSFDEEYSKSMGLNVAFYNSLMLCT